MSGDTTHPRRLVWKFDCQGFQPDDISVRTRGQHIVVIARKQTSQMTLKDTERTCDVPDGCDINKMTSKLTDRGILIIEAPYRAPEQRVVREIAVKHETLPAYPGGPTVRK